MSEALLDRSSSHLCEVCNDLFTSTPALYLSTSTTKPIRHHDCEGTLYSSALNGCYVCARLYEIFDTGRAATIIAEPNTVVVTVDFKYTKSGGATATGKMSYNMNFTMRYKVHTELQSPNAAENSSTVDQESVDSDMEHNDSELAGDHTKADEATDMDRDTSMDIDDHSPGSSAPDQLPSIDELIFEVKSWYVFDDGSTSRSRDVYVHLQLMVLPEQQLYSLGMSHRLGAGTQGPQAMEQARQWIKQCRSSHQHCRHRYSNQWLPTRLIQILGTRKDLTARLQNGMEASPGTEYLTLSHRWGPPKATPARVLLNDNTLKQFYESIDITALTAVFQHAISVTHALGFSYLWIDSLCIIQGNTNDWEKEGQMMHQIYRRAACNLSASCFGSGDEGLVNEERAINPMPAAIGPRRPSQNRDSQSATGDDLVPFSSNDVLQDISEQNDQQKFTLAERYPLDRMCNVPLFRRAWVLQEEILAPRTLHFSPEQIFWQCYEVVANEVWPRGFDIRSQVSNENSFGRGYSNDDFSHFILESNLASLAEKDEDEIYRLWRDILMNYTRRNITFSSDRIPALAGLCAAFQECLPHDTCYHGLWLRDPYSLLWSQKKEVGTSAVRHEVPSSSWAYVEQPIFWRYAHLPADRLIDDVSVVRPDSKIDEPGIALQLRGHLLFFRFTDLFTNDEHGAQLTPPEMGELLNQPPFTDRLKTDFDYWVINEHYDAYPLGVHAIPPIHFMPMLDLGAESQKKHRVWGLVLGQVGKAMYRRLGTGVFSTQDVDLVARFRRYQQALKDDCCREMYQEGVMRDDGMCTIALL